jgi:hypothetical protein
MSGPVPQPGRGALPPRLVLLSPGELTPADLPAFEREVAALAALHGARARLGVGLLLREALLEDRACLGLLERLRQRHGELPIGVHDRLHLLAPGVSQAAAAPAAAGAGEPRVGLERPWLHLAARSLSPAQARSLLPQACLGFSWHAGQTLPDPEALDYACLSPIRAVPHKGTPIGFEALAMACQGAALPLWGLGGLESGDGALLRAAGAAGAFVSRAWRAALAAGRLEAWLADFEDGLMGSGRP